MTRGVERIVSETLQTGLFGDNHADGCVLYKKRAEVERLLGAPST